jgi:hypothetical protein
MPNAVPAADWDADGGHFADDCQVQFIVSDQASFEAARDVLTRFGDRAQAYLATSVAGAAYSLEILFPGNVGRDAVKYYNRDENDRSGWSVLELHKRARTFALDSGQLDKEEADEICSRIDEVIEKLRSVQTLARSAMQADDDEFWDPFDAMDGDLGEAVEMLARDEQEYSNNWRL